MRIVEWVKRNRLLSVLLLLVGYYIYKTYFGSFMMLGVRQNMGYSPDYAITESSQAYGSAGMGGDAFLAEKSMMPSPAFYEGVSDSANRLVIQNSNLSLLVEDVRQSGEKIIDFAKSKGGFMVDSSYNRPEESAFGTITVRVPTTELDSTLSFLRTLAVKVTNENIQGTDVTEQYVDIDERLATLTKTKVKFEQIMDSATEVQDIIQVQQQLIYIQEQIDSLVGQKDALEKNASLTRVTVYLSTDELALPYTPDEKFRPNVVFKLAVRGLLTTFQGIGENAIWIAVYSVIWIPVLAVLYFVTRKRS